MKEPLSFVSVVRGENRLEIRNESDTAELTLIGAIGKSWWDDTGITEQEVRDALKAIPAGKKINARINSEGGSVKEGLGIYNAFKERRADITAHVTGYALSIASVFPLGAGKVVSPKSAIWMMHKAWSVNQGNADDMRQAADMLDAHDETLIDIYAAETGKPKQEIRSAMERETWIKGSQAVDFGLADETDDQDEDDSPAAYRPLPKEYLSRCKAPTAILNALSAHAQQGAITKTKPQEPTMNKTIIIALLKEHGIEASETETEEQLQAKLKQIPKATKTAASQPENKKEPETKSGTEQPVSRKEFEEMKAMLTRNAMTAKILAYVDKQVITNDEVNIWVNAAIADEAATIKILDAKEPTSTGTSGLNYSGIEILDPPSEPGTPEGLTGLRGPQSEMLVNIRKEHKTPKARYAAMKEVYNAAIKQALQKDAKSRRTDVYNTNTYSGTLVTSFLMDGSLTDLVNVWAMLAAFSRDSSVDPYKPLATGVLKHVTVAEATQTDATNFEPSDGSTVAPISVTMHQYTQTARVSNSDLNNGLRMDDLRQKNVAAFADKVIQVATAPIVSGTFTATPVITAPAAFSWSDMSTLRGQLKKSPIKNAILDGDYMARLENVPTFYQDSGVGNGERRTFGWNGIFENTNWTGAGANIRGFCCNPQALVGVTGLPLTPPNIPGGILQMTTFNLPGLEVAIALFQWFNPASRTMFVSWDIVGGFASGDTSAGIIVASGNPG